jgi:hypothetical protein
MLFLASVSLDSFSSPFVSFSSPCVNFIYVVDDDSQFFEVIFSDASFLFPRSQLLKFDAFLSDVQSVKSEYSCIHTLLEGDF